MTCNDAQHMVPGKCLNLAVSSLPCLPTYWTINLCECASRLASPFLSASYKAIEEEAAAVLQLSKAELPEDPSECAALLEGARFIRDHGFQPCGVMIDKNDAGRRVVQEAESAADCVY